MDSTRMMALLREPLLHFLLLGGALFVIFGWLNRGGREAPDEIVVDPPTIAHIASRFERTWQRPPTESELQSLVENWIREEILYREGVAMGLDRNDSIVRRRVARKTELFSETLAPYSTTDEELEAWLDEHADRYRFPSRYTFRQVFFDPNRHGDRLDEVVEAAQRRLAADANADVGDATMLPRREQDIEFDRIERVFGRDFSESLRGLEPGSWSEPLRSGFGVHLVLVESRIEDRAAELDEVRSAVERDLLADRAADARERYYEVLRDRYTVRIEADDEATTQP